MSEPIVSHSPSISEVMTPVRLVSADRTLQIVITTYGVVLTIQGHEFYFMARQQGLSPAGGSTPLKSAHNANALAPLDCPICAAVALPFYGKEGTL